MDEERFDQYTKVEKRTVALTRGEILEAVGEYCQGDNGLLFEKGKQPIGVPVLMLEDVDEEVFYFTWEYEG